MMHKDAITTIERIPISRIIVEQVEVKDARWGKLSFNRYGDWQVWLADSEIEVDP